MPPRSARRPDSGNGNRHTRHRSSSEDTGLDEPRDTAPDHHQRASGAARLELVWGKGVIAAVVILLVMGAVGWALNPSVDDFAWFLRLRRPAWLTFEALIPLIWIGIYACFYASALLSWSATSSWGLMAGYLGLLLLVQSYTWLICRTRCLRNGTRIGFAGWAWGVALAVVVAPQSQPAWLLLIPYLLWSPVGTAVTWQMQRLNR